TIIEIDLAKEEEFLSNCVIATCFRFSNMNFESNFQAFNNFRSKKQVKLKITNYSYKEINRLFEDETQETTFQDNNLHKVLWKHLGHHLKPVTPHDQYTKFQQMQTFTQTYNQQLNNLLKQNNSQFTPMHLQEQPYSPKKKRSKFPGPKNNQHYKNENRNLYQKSHSAILSYLLQESYLQKNESDKSSVPVTKKDICYNCKEPGRIKQYCPRDPQQTKQTIICYNCKKSGHIKRDCPRNQSL
ncbi:20614_t:CDS:2, partial [Gigaspora rosea]